MKDSDNLTGWLFGFLLCGLALTPYTLFLIKENLSDYDNDDIVMKEAPLLGVDSFKASSKKHKDFNCLKLDVNKNGVFDYGDIVIMNETDLPLEENKNIIYYENKRKNEKAVVAYQNKDDEYVLNKYEATEIIRKKFNEYMKNNKQK